MSNNLLVMSTPRTDMATNGGVVAVCKRVRRRVLLQHSPCKIGVGIPTDDTGNVNYLGNETFLVTGHNIIYVD